MRRNIMGRARPLRRERRPGGDRTAALESSNGNNNGLAYSQPVASLQAAAIRRLRRQRHVERICQLGPRIVFEFIDEIDRHYALGADLDRRLTRYSRLNPAILRAIGADRFPHPPAHMVALVREALPADLDYVAAP
jgi:hypothetical protein